MADLRKAARGRPCMVRLPGCIPGNETTVLAHYNRLGISGMATKAPDVCGAWACMNCHDMIDGRVKRPPQMKREDVELEHLRGVARTLAQLAKEGLI